MATGNEPFDLVDRIAAQHDRGLIPSTVSAPTNSEAAGRARLAPVARARVHGWDGEVATRRRLALLEEMLRNQPGVNVRQPSHHAAPYRAVEFESVGRFVTINATTSQVDVDLIDESGGATAGAPLTTAVDFGGGQRHVPEGHRAVITSISVELGTTTGATVNTPAWQVGFTWDLLVNRVPKFLGRTPRDLLMPLVPSGVFLSPPQQNIILAAPLNLISGDVVHLTGHLPSTAGGIAGRRPDVGWIGRTITTVRGYVYQVRVDEPSIRGTVVD